MAYVKRRTPYAVCRMPHTRTIGPLTPSLREKIISHWFESSPQQRRICHLPFPFFPVGDLAQISMYSLLTVHPETSLSQLRSTPIQISDAFSSGHDPVAQHMLDPSSISVSLSWCRSGMLVVDLRETSTIDSRGVGVVWVFFIFEKGLDI